MPTIIEELEAAAATDSLLRDENPLAKLNGEGGTVWHLLTGDTLISTTSEAQGWRVTTGFTKGQDGAQLDDAPHLQKVSASTYTYTIGTVSLSSKNAALRWYALWALKASGAVSGYRIRAEVETDQTKCKLRIEKATAGSFEVLAEQAGVSLENAEAKEVAGFAIVVGEGNVYFFVRKPGGSFEEFLKVADSTYTEGYAAMEGGGNFMRLKNFKVGTFIPVADLEATLSGQGALSPELRYLASAQATLSGSGSLSATLAAIADLEATLSGSGDLTAELRYLASLTAGLSGSSTLDGELGYVASLVATLSGSGELAATLAAIADLEASLSGSGELAATVSAVVNLAAELSGGGTFSGELRALSSLAADLAAEVALSAELGALASLAANLEGQGVLDADLRALVSLEAELSGSGAVVALLQKGTYGEPLFSRGSLGVAAGIGTHSR